MRKKPLRIVTCALAGTLLVATPVWASPVAGVTGYANAVVESELNTSSPVAGVSLAVAKYLENNTVAQKSSIEAVTEDEKQVASAEEDADTAADKKAAEKKAAKKASDKKKTKKEKSEYDDMAVAQVNDYVNIRRRPNEESKLVGKLYNDSLATVIKKSGDWYKIQSGSVTGFVKGDYIVVGDESLVKSVGVKVATVTTTTLKVREKASEKAEVLALVPGGEELRVTSLEHYKKGWVKVAVEGGRGYISTDYVEITRQYKYAESREEEEARLAAEQQRKEAEQAAQAAENDADTDSVSTASTDNTADSQQSSSASSTQSSSEQSAPSTTGTSSSGQAVVSYASQFVGNPYVYGGSSLTNGTDCSGFVMSVYAHFGVSLPHSSSALRSAGYGVSYSEMQPGDIVCYSGHVAIYVGNNTIIHASNPADGIKYTSPANYRSVVAVRRIF